MNTQIAKRDENEVVDTAADAFVQMVERAAANPAVDVDKLERLLAMKDRIEARQAEQAFNAAMTAAQMAMEPVRRDAVNPDNKSRYARLETVIEAINPIITKHGFSMSFGSEQSPIEKHYRVTCILAHANGYSRPYHADIPADLTGMKGTPNKTATHAFGSTMSYGRRYLTLLIFNVALVSEDDDGKSASGNTKITDDQVANLQRLIMDMDADIAKVLAFLHVENLSDLTASQYDKAVHALDQWARKAGKK